MFTVQFLADTAEAIRIGAGVEGLPTERTVWNKRPSTSEVGCHILIIENTSHS